MSALLERLPADLRERLRPSNIECHLLCPLLAKFKREWAPRFMPWTPNLALGTAVHEGVHASLVGESPESAFLRASEALQQDFAAQETWELGKLQKMAHRGVEEALRALALPASEWRVSEETCFLGTPDLVTETLYTHGESLTVTDVKCHLSAGGHTDDYGVSLQLWAYVEEASRRYGRPVDWFRVVEVVFTPRVTAQIVPFRVTLEQRAWWRGVLRTETERIIQEWKHEHAEEACTGGQECLDHAPVTGNPTACYRYGRCVAFEGCHEFQGNDTRMRTLYTPRAKAIQ